jgi:pimeloyl-ACP methyl ester carboxylesterase
MAYEGVSGVRLHYLEEGDGTPLFLLHGNAGSGRVWRKAIATLQSHYRIFAYDRRGFGHWEETETGY